MQRSLSVLLASLPLLVSAEGALGYCAKEPPPGGLVPRCRQLVLTLVPSSRTALELSLHNWMDTCVSKERAIDLVSDNDSIDEVWRLIEGRPGWQGGVTILPDYTPNSWVEDGETCYGVESVRFSVKGAQGEVDADGPIDVVTNPAPTGDDIASAAARADGGFAKTGAAGMEISRMRSVLHAMQTYGADLDDTYYTLAPVNSGDPMTPGPACFREVNLTCLPADEAVRACEAHLSRELVREARNGASDEALANLLAGRADQIDRGLRYMFLIQAQESPGAVPCPNLPDAIFPAISRKSQDAKSLYYWWNQGP